MEVVVGRGKGGAVDIDMDVTVTGGCAVALVSAGMPTQYQSIK